MTQIKDLVPKEHAKKIRMAVKGNFITNEIDARAIPHIKKHKEIQRKQNANLRNNISNKIKKALAMSTPQTKRSNKAKLSKRSITLKYLSGKITANQARSLGVEINGGRFLIDKQLQKEIMTYIEQENPLRKLATIHKGKGVKGFPVQVKKAKANIAEVERDENNLIPESEIEFEEYTLSPVEFDAMAKITTKLIKMSDVEIGKVVVEELGKAYLRKEVDWHISNKNNSGSLINKAVKFATRAPIANPYIKLVHVKNAIPTAMRKNATWLINRSAQTLLESLLDTTGNPILKEFANDDFSFSLLNYPVEVSDYVDKEDESQPVIYFGDFSYFHIQDVLERMEIQVLDELFTRESKKGYSIYNLGDGQLIYGPFEIPVFNVEL